MAFIRFSKEFMTLKKNFKSSVEPDVLEKLIKVCVVPTPTAENLLGSWELVRNANF